MSTFCETKVATAYHINVNVNIKDNVSCKFWKRQMHSKTNEESLTLIRSKVRQAYIEATSIDSTLQWVSDQAKACQSDGTAQAAKKKEHILKFKATSLSLSQCSKHVRACAELDSELECEFTQINQLSLGWTVSCSGTPQNTKPINGRFWCPWLWIRQRAETCWNFPLNSM